ncbi:MerR family transcriptional regulator [Paenibacillus sp. CAU 1782]
MELQKITGIMEKFGVTSRTLRYYEQMGILQRMLSQKALY